MLHSESNVTIGQNKINLVKSNSYKLANPFFSDKFYHILTVNYPRKKIK